MLPILLVLLVVFDFGLLIYVYLLSNKKSDTPIVQLELAAERKILEELRTSLKDQMTSFKSEIGSMKDEIVVLVTEAELEHKGIKDSISENTEALVSEIEAKLDEPLKYMNQRCESIQRGIDTLKKERSHMLQAIKKAETLVQFFNKKVPYEEILEEIASKKYVDARHMISSGTSPESVASQLNMPLSEVKLLISLG